LKVILRGLGIQNEYDLSFLTSDHATTYVRQLENHYNGDNTNDSIENRKEDLLVN